MLERLKAAWQLWRIGPGLRAAAVDAAKRAYSNPNTAMLGPEKNLINLSNDLVGECTRLKLIAFG